MNLSSAAKVTLDLIFLRASFIILTGCITAWFGNCTTLDRQALLSEVRMAQHNHWGRAPSYSGHSYQAVSEEGPKNCNYGTGTGTVYSLHCCVYLISRVFLLYIFSS
jgi:hypothetical protein